MNKLKSLIALLLSISMILVLSGCKKPVKREREEALVNVTVADVKNQTIEETVTYTGEIKAAKSTSVSAKVSGNAKTIYCEVGDYVKKGDILLKIDDTDYQTQYDQAVAGVKQAQASYEQANAAYEAAVASYNSVVNGSSQQSELQLKSVLDSAKIEYDNAKNDYEKQKVLYENGAVSKSVYDAAVTRYENAQLNYNTAKKNYDLTVGVILEETKANAQSAVNSAEAGKSSAQAMLNSSKVAVEAAENSLNNTVIRAPISGYISNKNANIGQMVSPGIELFSIKDTSTVNAEIKVTESVIAKVSVGSKVIITVDTVGQEIEGNVSVASPTKNVQTGMYDISVSVDNPEGILKDGMFANIKLVLSAAEDATVVPSEAILEAENGEKFVYIVDGNDAKKVSVVVGIVTDEFTEITEGVSEGDRVVVSGKEYLSDKNNKIKIVK